MPAELPKGSHWRNPTARRGYVLLMTLLVLAVAAAVMAGVCRASMEKAVRAARAGEDLQRRWGVMSCRAALLPKAEEVLARAGRAAGESGEAPPTEARLHVRLGTAGQEFALTFGDEQAKASLNFLYRRDGRAAERAVREIAAASGARVTIELRPVAAPAADGEDDAEEEEAPPAFETLGQIFGYTPPDELLARRGNLPAVASQVTVWGDGLLNIRRAPAAVLRRVCGPRLTEGQAAAFVAARDEALREPDADVWEVLDEMNLPDETREAVEEVTTDQSTCHSLWVVTSGGGRRWYDLAVSGGEEGAGPKVLSFSW